MESTLAAALVAVRRSQHELEEAAVLLSLQDLEAFGLAPAIDGILAAVDELGDRVEAALAGELDAPDGGLGGGDLGRRGGGGRRSRGDGVDGAAGVAGVDVPGRALDWGLGLGGGSPEDERGGDQGAGKQEASHAQSVVSPPPPVKDFFTEHFSVIVVDIPRRP